MSDQIVFQISTPAPSSVEAISSRGSKIDLLATNIAAIDGVYDDLIGADAIGTVAADLLGANYTGLVGANITDVITVSGISGGVTAVADIDAETVVVAGISTKVVTVADDTVAINGVWADLDGTDTIGTVATNLSGTNTIGTVAAIDGNVTTVAGISSNVTTVAGISANVTTVAGISGNVTTVAGISANVTTVADNDANVTTVATDLDLGASSKVTITANSIANVNLVGGDITNVNTVAGISANVTTVAGNDANVTIVAGSIAGVNTAATNIDAIIAAPTAATTATDKANLAEQWAEEAEDTEVETGKYSSKHYSLKAEASKTAAELAQTTVQNSADQIDINKSSAAASAFFADQSIATKFHNGVDDPEVVYVNYAGERIGYIEDNLQYFYVPSLDDFRALATTDQITSASPSQIYISFVNDVDEEPLDPVYVSDDGFRQGGFSTTTGGYVNNISNSEPEAGRFSQRVYESGTSESVGLLTSESLLVSINNGVGLIGQSFASAGGASGTFARPPITTSQSEQSTARMLAATSGLQGPLYTEGTEKVTATSLVPLVSNTVETMLPGMADRIGQFEEDEFGTRRSWVYGGAARSSREYLELRRGDPEYNGLLDFVRNARDLSELEGCRFVMRYVVIALGTNDDATYNEDWRYRQDMREYMNNMTEDILALNPQQEMLQFIITQNSRSKVAQGLYANVKKAQLETTKGDFRALFGGPWYAVEATTDVADFTHPSNVGEFHMGEYVGDVAASTLYGSSRPAPHIQHARRTGTDEVTIWWSEPMGLEIDDSVINTTGIAGYYGLEVYSNDTLQTISSHSFDASNMVMTVTMNADLGSAYNNWVHLAQRSNTGTPKPLKDEGSRSCFHAIDGEFTSSHDARAMKRWAATDRVEIT